MTPPSRHISVRLPSDLADRLAAHAAEHRITRSDAIASLIECGLRAISENVTQCLTVSHSELVERVAAMEAAIEALQGKKKRVPIEGQPDHYYLGTLCKNGHDYEGSGMSRRSDQISGGCVKCKADRRKR